jgi:hypothetical protein
MKGPTTNKKQRKKNPHIFPFSFGFQQKTLTFAAAKADFRN